MDALAEKFFQYSSYDYVGGNPVIRIDIDGRDWYQFGDEIRWIEASDENLTMNGDEWKNIGAAIHVTVEYSDGRSYNWLGGDDGSVTYFADEVEIAAERTSSTQEENYLVEFGNSMTFSMISAGASGGTVKASDILLRSSRYGNQNYYNFRKPFGSTDKGGFVKRSGSVKIPLGPVHTHVPAQKLLMVRNAASTASKALGYAGAGFYVANLVLDDEYSGSTEASIDGAIVAIGFIPGGWLVAGGLSLVKYGLEETGNDFWNE